MAKVTIEEIVDKASRERSSLLEETLKSGVPIRFRDAEGNLVKKYPDGKIEVIEGAQCPD